jgi:hypothetical protein
MVKKLLRRRAMRRRGDDAGFSIVESVVAGAILSIGAVLSMQYFATAASVTVHQRTRDQGSAALQGVLESQESLGCLSAVTAAQVTAATSCGTDLGAGSTTVALDGRNYTVTWSTAWVVAGAGSDTLRLKETASVSWPEAAGTQTLGPVVRYRPVTGQSLEQAGTATVTLTTPSPGSVALVVGGRTIAHVTDASNQAVFPYLPAGTYQFKIVGNAALPKSVVVTDGGTVAATLP